MTNELSSFHILAGHLDLLFCEMSCKSFVHFLKPNCFFPLLFCRVLDMVQMSSLLDICNANYLFSLSFTMVSALQLGILYLMSLSTLR
jgi:hypothetical protein